jgi:prevent-host-death family protein
VARYGHERVGVTELKAHLSRYLRAVEAGEVIEVTDHGRPIVRMVPLRQEAEPFTIRPALRPFSEIRDRRFESLGLPVNSTDLLLEERGRR